MDSPAYTHLSQASSKRFQIQIIFAAPRFSAIMIAERQELNFMLNAIRSAPAGSSFSPGTRLSNTVPGHRSELFAWTHGEDKHFPPVFPYRHVLTVDTIDVTSVERIVLRAASAVERAAPERRDKQILFYANDESASSRPATSAPNICCSVSSVKRKVSQRYTFRLWPEARRRSRRDDKTERRSRCAGTRPETVKAPALLSLPAT